MASGPRKETSFFSFIRPRQRSLVILLLFIAYAAAVLWSHYSSLQRFRENDLQQFQLEAEKQATVTAYFFSERENDILELVESRAIGGFFFNQDLGMSYEYGLGINVQIIEDAFESLALRKRIAGKPIYLGFALVDGQGQLIARWNPESDYAGFSTKPDATNHATRIFFSPRHKKLLISAPVWINNAYRGEILAWIKPDSTFAQFGATPSDGETLLIDRESGMPIDAPRDGVWWNAAAWREAAAGDAPRETRRMTMRLPSGEQRQVAWVDIPHTPFAFVSIAGERRGSEGMTRMFLILAGVVPLIVVLLSILEEKERRRLDALREQARHEAERLATARSEFLANMSHEIRTPMNAIIGITELCLASELPPRQYNYITKIQRASNSLLHIINDILDFSRIESGMVTIANAPFAVDAVLGGVGELLAEKAAEKSLEIVFDVDPSVDSDYIGDSLRIEQVLINLVGNAIKFTTHGDIVVSVRRETRGDGDLLLHFAVTDQGVGLSPEEQARIFHAFVQADATTTRRFGGSGLGLVISKRLVELMGGEIAVKSAPGEGSEFSFFVRVATSAHTRETHLDAIRKSLAPHTARPVVVIDDNPAALAALAGQLRRLGLAPETFSDTQGALERLRRDDAPDVLVVFIDAALADLETCKTMRGPVNCPRPGRQAPLVILIRASDNDRRIENDEHLFDGSIVKPTTAPRLFAAIAPSLGLAPVTRRHQDALADGGLAGFEVLLVDDVALNLEVAHDMLKGLGVRVRTAANGQEALDAIAERLPDCVVMDCQMPVMDGYEATRRLRQDERTQKLPIIALTASVLPAERERCRAAGMDGYLAKPIHCADLLDALRAQLPSCKATDAATSEAEPASGKTAAPSVAASRIDTRLGLGYANGNPAIYRRILRIFLKTYRDGSFSEFGTASQSGDWKEATRHAHSLKSSALTIGAAHLGELARALEAAAREENAELASQCLSPLVQELALVCSELERTLPDESPQP